MLNTVCVKIIYPGEFATDVFFTYDNQPTDLDVLERIFAEWNHGSGAECEKLIKSNCRSLSVHDIVVVNGQYYQCKSIGWEPVTEEFVIQLQRDVKNHINYNQSAWYALDCVMWERNKKLVGSLTRQ